MEELISEKLLGLLKEKGKQERILQTLAELLEDEDALEMLPLMEDRFEVLFDKFANNSELMRWEQFHSFCMKMGLQSSYLS